MIKISQKNLGFLVSGLVGVIIGVLFRDRLLGIWQSLSHLFYGWRGPPDAEALDASNETLEKQFEIVGVKVGKWYAAWVVVASSNSEPYLPHSIICQYDQTPVVLPYDLQERKNRIAEEQETQRVGTGRSLYHNSATVAFSGVMQSQDGALEEPILTISLRASDYYTFLATAMRLDEVIQTEQGKPITLREKYLHRPDYSLPLPEFASLFAIQACVLTSDNYLVVSKRGTQGIAVYPGYIAPAVNETVNPLVDKATDGNLSLLATVKRGALSELGMEVADDEVEFFSVGADVKWYIYSIVGLIRSKSVTREALLSRRSIGSNEKWEVERLYFLPFNPEGMARTMRDISHTEKWSAYGIVNVVQAAIAEFGFPYTERALSIYGPNENP